MPICPLCNERLAGSDKGYALHIEHYHTTKKKTKKDIVEAWEYRNARYIVASAAHSETCRCNSCFHKALDLLVQKTEEHINGH